MKRSVFLLLILALSTLLTLSCVVFTKLLTNSRQTPDSTSLPVEVIHPATATSTITATSIVSSIETPTPNSNQKRSWPETSHGIHVFNDQLLSTMSEPLWQFSATHYVGAQKMSRSNASQIRAINPNFIILNYRLGLGLGYRSIQNGCQPAGDWLLLVEGDEWVQEWPGDYAVPEEWLYHWPENSHNRVLNCDWGWYLAELNDNGWKKYWQDDVLRQIKTNDGDGVFMDSLSVPNYMGFNRFEPNLPEVDADFENAWSNRIENWLQWLQSQPIGEYSLIPNAGSWITTRDISTYAAADGLMIEGFAMEADASPYALTDWQLQMNRILNLVSQNKIIIAQAYVSGDQERMFTLGSYLLIKGDHSYLNIELSEEPEWWPEYDIPIGTPLQSTGTDIASLFNSNNNVYRRDFDNGFILVNPTNPYDRSGQETRVELGGTYYLAQTSGGGSVPENGIPTGTVSYEAVEQVTLPPYSAALLLSQAP